MPMACVKELWCFLQFWFCGRGNLCVTRFGWRKRTSGKVFLDCWQELFLWTGLPLGRTLRECLALYLLGCFWRLLVCSDLCLRLKNAFLFFPSAEVAFCDLILFRVLPGILM